MAVILLKLKFGVTSYVGSGEIGKHFYTKLESRYAKHDYLNFGADEEPVVLVGK